MTSLAENIAADLLSIDAVSLSPNAPYTWASGIKSPIYCDNRITMSFPDVRNRIATGLAEIIKEKYPDVEVIAGTATAGIPHAAWVAQILNLPMIYIRSSAKDHGKGNQIEGLLKKNQKVIVIEDLISTGGSVIEACNAVTDSGGEVQGVVAIFTYELPKGKENFNSNRIILDTLTNYSTLIDVAISNKTIKEEDKVLLTEWRENPYSWGQ